MYGIVKCFPTSRRNSSIEISLSQSRLFTMTAAFGPSNDEEPLQLGADSDEVRLERLAVEQVAFGGRPGRVADHARPAADEHDGPAAPLLEVDERRDRHEVADVERRAGRIEPVVGGDLPAGRQTRPRVPASRRGRGPASAARRGTRGGRRRVVRGAVRRRGRHRRVR